MTKQEAIEKMKLGHKVAHRYFTCKEWITMNKRGEIVTEDGFIVPEKEFWHYRTHESFSKDWFIHETDTKSNEQIDYLENNY